MSDNPTDTSAPDDSEPSGAVRDDIGPGKTASEGTEYVSEPLDSVTDDEDGGGGGGGDGTGENETPAADLVQVNSQIIDAVQQTRSAMRVAGGDSSMTLDSGISYQKASQAAALAVQDATDYLRNVMTIASTAEGMALKLLIETKNPFYTQVLEAAQDAVSKAAQNLETVGASAIQVATTFPR